MNRDEARRIADALQPLPGRWLPVVGYESTYMVSDRGEIYSHPRPRARGGLRRLFIDKYGYPSVGLVQDGQQARRRVHILVAEAFIGPRPEGMDVRHLDGDPGNARVENLAYGTKSQNAYDSVRHGTNPMSRRDACAHGHPYTEENTYVKRGARYCRTCWRVRGAANRARKRAAA